MPGHTPPTPWRLPLALATLAHFLALGPALLEPLWQVIGFVGDAYALAAFDAVRFRFSCL